MSDEFDDSNVPVIEICGELHSQCRSIGHGSSDTAKGHSGSHHCATCAETF